MSSQKKWIKLGRVLREWGIRGEVKCICFNPESALFSEVSHLYIEAPEGFRQMEIEAGRPHDQYWRLKFKDLNTPEEAKKIRGRFLVLPREELPELKEGEIYISDLEGLSVLGPDEEVLGRVQGFQKVGDTNSLLIGENKKNTVPIPYEEDFIQSMDLKHGNIKLKEMGLELIKINRPR